MAKQLAVIGAGLMGSGIAQVSAVAGYDVVLRDVTPEALARGVAGIEASLGKFASKGKISRDDAETSFLGLYRQQGLLSFDPFDTLDERGVGRLMELSCSEGRAARPGLGLGLCGEHGGNPASVRFCADLGLDYVSCSPPRVPVARLEAGRAAVLSEMSAAGSDTR